LTLAFSQGKILGGYEAAVGEIPYQVALTCGEDFFCGGAIIAKLLILTAAQ